jgi:hypothetical protein
MVTRTNAAAIGAPRQSVHFMLSAPASASRKQRANQSAYAAGCDDPSDRPLAYALLR